MKVHGAVQTPRGGLAAGLAGTLAVHLGVVALALGLGHTTAKPPGPPVYAVELIAAPAPTEARRLAPEALPTPPPEEPPAPVQSTPEPAEPAVPAPRPEPRPPERTENRERAAPTRSEVEPLPGETPGTGTDVANIKTPGLAFPFPEYLRNIANQVLRRFGVQSNRLRAEVSFLIMRDGSVREVKFVTRSGNFTFDLDAQGAIEAAANAGAFGMLPEGWESDVLPVVFVFEPR